MKEKILYDTVNERYVKIVKTGTGKLKVIHVDEHGNELVPLGYITEECLQTRKMEERYEQTDSVTVGLSIPA